MTKNELEVRQRIARISIDINQAGEAYARGDMNRFYKNCVDVVEQIEEVKNLGEVRNQ